MNSCYQSLHDTVRVSASVPQPLGLGAIGGSANAECNERRAVTKLSSACTETRIGGRPEPRRLSKCTAPRRQVVPARAWFSVLLSRILVGCGKKRGDRKGPVGSAPGPSAREWDIRMTTVADGYAPTLQQRRQRGWVLAYPGWRHGPAGFVNEAPGWMMTPSTGLTYTKGQGVSTILYPRIRKALPNPIRASGESVGESRKVEECNASSASSH